MLLLFFWLWAGFEIGNKGCCGSGMVEVAFLCSFTCANVSEYVFWDSFHLTEKAYRIMVHQVLEKDIKSFFWQTFITLFKFNLSLAREKWNARSYLYTICKIWLGFIGDMRFREFEIIFFFPCSRWFVCYHRIVIWILFLCQFPIQLYCYILTLVQITFVKWTHCKKYFFFFTADFCEQFPTLLTLDKWIVS